MGCLVLLFFVLLFVSIKAEEVPSVLLSSDSLLDVLFQAAELANRNDRKGLELAKEVVAQYPQHAEGRQLLGKQPACQSLYEAVVVC